MPKGRTYSLTQRGLTYTCNVCDGLGCVLAMAVIAAVDDSGSGMIHPAHADRAHEVLVPCPGCFIGMPWVVIPDGQ